MSIVSSWRDGHEEGCSMEFQRIRLQVERQSRGLVP